MIDITLENFEAEVLQASMQAPVLLDIWATWCGPCKQLGPVLEQLETDYAGRFVLAKLDADKVPQIAGQLSQMFGVRSIPFCVLFYEGQPVDGFVGALPAAEVREFLDRHLSNAKPVQAEAVAPQTPAPEQPEGAQAAQDRLADALAADPGNNDLRFDYVKGLIGSGQLNEAAAALAPAMAQIPVELRFEALNQWLNALEFVANDPRGRWSMAQFDELLTDNRRDFATRFAKSRLLIAQGEWPLAMDELLEIIQRDKKWDDEAPRKTYVALLELLTPPRPKPSTDASGKSATGIALAGKAALQEDPQAMLVSTYRRRLSMALN
ncbi:MULTISPECIES: tetratricopeptide repeat protein [Giesbergeria]|uniref:Tetratricopeptide repeat protein n=1 Tax=Giesbergeria sinuosa TaxID=80883 RepID=A0ABV9QGI5_9BURK